MFDDLKTFVPSEYCLTCRGCCVFIDQPGADVWHPRAGAEELSAIGEAAGCATGEFATGSRLKTEAASRGRQCVFINPPDHRCRIYPARPFECRLYPFLLSSESDGIKLYAHLSCPFIQDQLDTKEGADFAAVLRAFFSRPDVRRYLSEGRARFADYSPFSNELRLLFDARRTFASGLLARREIFERVVGSGRRVLSARAFANLFLWQEMFDFDFEDINGALCVFARQPVGSFLYLPPLGGALTPETINRAFVRMDEDNRGGSLGRIENLSLEDAGHVDTSRYLLTERGQEYVYRREDIVGLNGQAYKSQRHDINLLHRTARPEYRRYAPSDRAGCSRLFERWLDRKLGPPDDDKNDLSRQMLFDARGAHACLWDFADELGLEGRVVEVDGRIAAYTFGCRLDEETFCVLAEIADPDVAGLAAFIFHAFADDEAVRPYRFLNAMDDYGLPSVRRTKMAWRPAALEPVFAATRKAPDKHLNIGRGSC